MSVRKGEFVIVTTIRMRTDSDHRKELMQTVGGLFQQKSQDHGCLSRYFYREIGNDDSVLLVEEWESESDWREHLKSTEFAVLLGAMSLLEDPKVVEFKLMSQVGSVDCLKKLRITNDTSI